MSTLNCLSIDFDYKKTNDLIQQLNSFLIHHKQLSSLVNLKETQTNRLIFHPRIQSFDQLPPLIYQFLLDQQIDQTTHTLTDLDDRVYKDLWRISFFSQSKDAPPLLPDLPQNWKRVLSNFYPSILHIDGLSYSSVEHFFQAQKALYSSLPSMAQWFTIQFPQDDHKKVSHHASEAKKAGARKRYHQEGAVLNVDQWIEKRVSVMKQAIWSRFEQDLLFQKILLSTQGFHLLHFERAGKKSFWGGVVNQVTGEMNGYNQLGILMMERRSIG